ncbi:MAG: helix-hairpin-helix domain-containing protein [Rikenellaceae bacterium]
MSSESNIGRNIVTMVMLIIIVSLVVYIENMNSSAEVVEELNTTMESRPEVDSVAILKPFDPNTVELKELLDFGLTKYEALSLLRYRASGKIFHIKEEVIGCYGFSDSLYFALEPYLVIGEEFRYKSYNYSDSTQTNRSYNTQKRARPTPLTPSKFLIDTVGIQYLNAIGALSIRQAEVFVKWRDLSGIHTIEELRECYVVSDSIATWLAKYAIFTERPKRESATKADEDNALIDLNRADSAALRSVRGIGEKSVVAIMDYRERLGGFYSLTQLAELDVIRESNYEKIITQIFTDSCDISKIYINFASAKEMSSHPYIAPRLRKLLKLRQLKGGWSTIEEMINDDIFTIEEAQKVRPYLHFKVPGDYYAPLLE